LVDLIYHVVGPHIVDSASKIYGPISSASQYTEAVSNFLGDGLFTCPTYNFIKAVSMHSQELYTYRFIYAAGFGSLAKQAFEVLGSLMANADNGFDKAYGLLLESMGVPHTFDLFFIFRLPSNPNHAYVNFDSERSKRISDVFMAYWGQFINTLKPWNDRMATIRKHYPPPEWKPFNSSDPMNSVLRIQDPPSMTPVSGDIEEETDRRCSWWAKHPTALRAREKPWQLQQRVETLGMRCCCDTSQDPPVCVRVTKSDSPEIQKVGNDWRIPVKADWLGFCPKLDLGKGLTDTVHDPLGCVVQDVRDVLTCCCLSPEQVPDAFQQDPSNPKPVCQHFTTADLWFGKCPKVCDWDRVGPRNGLPVPVNLVSCGRWMWNWPSEIEDKQQSWRDSSGTCTGNQIAMPSK